MTQIKVRRCIQTAVTACMAVVLLAACDDEEGNPYDNRWIEQQGSQWLICETVERTGNTTGTGIGTNGQLVVTNGTYQYDEVECHVIRTGRYE